MSSDWQEVYSQTYQRVYWFNPLTGDSLWHNPNLISNPILTSNSNSNSVININSYSNSGSSTIDSNSDSNSSASGGAKDESAVQISYEEEGKNEEGDKSKSHDDDEDKQVAKRRRADSPLAATIASSSSSSSSSSRLLSSSSIGEEEEALIEESPLITIKREAIRDQLLTMFSDDNSKFGEMKGSSKTALSCRQDGMKIGMQGLFGRILWSQLLNQVQTLGDVGTATRDPVFPRTFLRDEAVIKEFVEFGRSSAQSEEIMTKLGQNFVRASEFLIRMRQSLSPSVKDDCIVSLSIHSSDTTASTDSIAALDPTLTYSLRCNTTAYVISGRHLAKLLRLYRLHTDSSASATDQLFLRRVFCVIGRYETVSGTSEGYQMAFPDSGFQWLRDHVGVKIECFASPLNCWNQRFCSVARDTDRFFGSLGNFFLFDRPTGRLTEDDLGLPEGGSFEANPPFVESIMNTMAERIEYLLGKHSASPFSFVVIVPAWTDCRGIEIMNNSIFARPHRHFKLTLLKRQHNYRPGMQQRSKLIEQPSNVDTFVYFLQNDAGARRWPVTEAMAEELKTMLAKEVGTKR